MSSKQEQGAEKSRAEPSELRKLWKQPPSRWVELLDTVGTTRVHAHGPVIKLCCPYHPDHTPSAHIHTEKGYFKCFGCSKFVLDPIRFLTPFFPGGYAAALQGFKSHFGLDKQIDSAALTEAEIEQRRVHLLSDIFHAYLCDVWNADQMPETAKKTVAWLKNRGITDVQGLASIGMMPRLPVFETLARQHQTTSEDLAWCKHFIGNYLNNAYTDCVVYAYATSPEHITGFKLRPPGPDKSAVQTLVVRKEGPRGAFGVLTPAFYSLYGTEHVTRFVAVEGEHDQLALYCGQALRGEVNEVVFALGGTGHSGLTFARELGFKTCRLVGDDDAGGLSYPASILPKTRDIGLEVFQWPAPLRHPQGGKFDPDEAIRAHGFVNFFAAVCQPANYIHSVRWCLNQAQTELTGVHPDNVQATKAIATKFTALLSEESEKYAFAEAFSKLRPELPVVQLVRASLAQEDTALGFAARVVDWFKKTYEVTQWERHNGELTLWHCGKQQQVRLLLDAPSVVTKLISDFPNGCLYTWAKTEIGLPGFAPDPTAPDATETSLKKCEAIIEGGLIRALRQLVQDASDDLSNIKGQGIHLVDADETGHGYIVNGKRVYKLGWDATRENLISAELLPGATDGKVVFDLGKKPVLISDMNRGWTSLFLDAKDLLSEPVYAREQTFEMVHTLIHRAFGFEHQEVDALYCSGLVFYNYMYDIFFRRRSLTHFSAQYASGKTSLLSVTANHIQLQEFSLCDHAHALDSFTQAAFHQMFTNTRLVAALDEMNDLNDNSRDSEKKREFYVKCRTLATSGEASVSQGTQDGNGRKYSIRTSVITASGSIIHNEMDASRFNTIFLKKDPERANVRATLQNTYDSAVYQNLRRSIFLHSLRLAPQIYRTHLEMARTYDPNELNRFIENLLPVAAVLKIFGLDGLKFVKDYRDSRKKQTVERDVNTPGHQLLDKLLNTPFPFKDDDTQTTTIKSMLLNPSQRDRINQSKTGIYYDGVTQCLAIAWTEVRAAFRGMTFNRQPASLIFDLKSAGDWVIPAAEAQRKGIFRRLVAVGLVSRPEVVSVISVGDNIIERVALALSEQAAEETAIAVRGQGEDPLPGM